MIKPIHEITLKDVILLDATKSASHLKKYWFIPIYFCRAELEKLASEIFTSIGDNSIDELQIEISKLISYNNLQILEALYKAVQIELNLKTRINVWKIILEQDYKESEQLKEVVSEVLKYTGIEIKTPKDITDLEEYITFRIDKYRETYPEKKQEEIKPDVKLQKVLYSVFNYLGEPYNVDMLLISFVEMKQMAEEKIRKSQIQNDNEQQ